MKKKIDKTDALALLVRAVAEKGESHIDKRFSHVYFEDNGTPSCGVGLALSYVGVKRYHVFGRNSSKVYDMARIPTLPIVLDDGAIKVLEKFRAKQDAGTPWGECLDEAARV